MEAKSYIQYYTEQILFEKSFLFCTILQLNDMMG